MKDSRQVLQLPLLPGRLRPPGFILVLMGAALLVTRFYFGIKPEWLNRKVFALYSSYLETKKMQVISNQLLEELAAFLLLAGLMMLAFSREKKETELTGHLRLKSFLLATYITAAVYVAGLFLLYGLSFMVYMLVVPFLFLAVYIIIFRVFLYRCARQRD